MFGPEEVLLGFLFVGLVVAFPITLLVLLGKILRRQSELRTHTAADFDRLRRQLAEQARLLRELADRRPESEPSAKPEIEPAARPVVVTSLVEVPPVVGPAAPPPVPVEPPPVFVPEPLPTLVEA